MVLTDVEASASMPAKAEAAPPRLPADAGPRRVLIEVPRSSVWWSLLHLVFSAARTVVQYRTKRTYLWSLGYRRSIAVRKALWHVRQGGAITPRGVPNGVPKGSERSTVPLQERNATVNENHR